MANKCQVLEAHRSHPDWTSRQIGDHIGASDAYVRATAKRNGLTLGRRYSVRSKESLLAEARALIARAETAPTEAEIAEGDR